MGRSDRLAPRICSALELRTQVASMALMSLNVLPDSTVTLSKPAAAAATSSSPPPSPDTPGQTPPARVKPQEAWSQDVLQLMQQQVAVLSFHDSNGGGGNAEYGKRKRDCGMSAPENLPFEKLQCDKAAAAAAAGGVEVELHAQSHLPEEWEQFLDLKTGELYYFHWGSCKRAKSDPREVVRRANDSVLALELKAQARFIPKDNDTGEYYSAAAAPADVATTCTDLIASSETDNGCLQASSSQASPGEVESAQSEEEKLSKCDDDDEEESSNCELGMVALSCNHCTMFVLLSLSSPSCPSCGEYLQCKS